jgi:Flp pilus assembly protein TadD
VSATEQMKLAVSASARGDMATAKRAGEAALRLRPHDPNILELVGVISCQSGDIRRGADLLRKAMRSGPKSPTVRLNLARALYDLGELAEAESLCLPAGKEPAPPELQRMHADILKAQGRFWEAVVAYERLVQANPEDFESWNNLGNARHEVHELEGALAALQQALALQPGSSLARINMGRVLLSMDRYEDACLIFEQAALRAPKDPAPLLELGRTLTSIDHPEAALKALGTAARLDPRDPRIFVAIGVAFNDLAQLDQAERAFRFALQADPAFTPAYVNLGLLLEKANRLEEFDALIAKVAATGARGPELDYLRALSLSRRGAHAEALELAQTVRTSAVQGATIFQFVGQLADRLNRTDEASAAFEEMNRAASLTPLAVHLDRTAYQRGIDRVAAETTGEWLSRWAEAPPIADPPAPAFLVGFPRSGTTLLDTFLMGHPDAHVLEELPILEKLSNQMGSFTRLAELTAAEVAEVRSEYFAELSKLSPPAAGKLVIDKNPLSMLRLPLIHRLFPDAKLILLLRHPCDVVLSCFMQNFKVTEAMASFLDLENASRTYDRIFSYWEQCRELFPASIYSLRYEDLVADPKTEVAPLLDFLGLAPDESILDHQKTALARGYIRTPSYAQVTERVYTRASGRWTRYRRQMEPVLPILAPWAERYGYSLD